MFVARKKEITGCSLFSLNLFTEKKRQKYKFDLPLGCILLIEFGGFEKNLTYFPVTWNSTNP